MPITADIKKKHLKSLSLALRHELEGYFDNGQWHAGDLEQRLMSLGVRRERDALPLDEMVHLPDYDQRARKKVDQYIALRTAAGMTQKDAVGEFVRETAYTWANRLLALRCMEARELIDEVILQKEVYSGRSLEHNRLLRARPELASQEDDGLFLALEQAFSRMAQHLPLLFDPHAPSVALRPSPAALKRCITLLSSGDGAVFKEPDALGWAYQFWNSEEKKRVFDSVRTKKAKIAGADIIPATQLYTEPYMVKFLVQNSLGATWLGMHPESKLADSWEYFVRDADRAPVAEKDRKQVADLSFLDPACGSGHFLLEAFDLLFDMYKEEGVVTEEVAICQHILEKNLYGIDIDERAVQIAEAALWCKAKERTFDFTSARTNLIATNLRLPKDKNHLQSFLDKHPEDKPLKDALEKIFSGLENAAQLGSLLQIAEPVEKELRRIKEKDDTELRTSVESQQRSLFAPQSSLPVSVESWDVWRTRTGERLRSQFAEEAEAADLAQQFFSAQASRGWRLFELLGRRYDVVAANPPYISFRKLGTTLLQELKNLYEDSYQDLYTAFIERAGQLAEKNGVVAMITLHTWMSLNDFSQARLRIFSEKYINCAAMLGTKTFADLSNTNAMGFCMFILSPRNGMDGMCTFIDCSLDENKLISIKKRISTSLFITKNQSKFDEIPGSPIAYLAPDAVINAFSTNEKIGSICQAGQGRKTGDNDRFLRYFWECPIQLWRDRWFPCTRGGTYRRWRGNYYAASEWQDNGVRLRNFFAPNGKLRSRPQNTDLYFVEGITWTTHTTYGFAARHVDAGFLIESAGPIAIPHRKDYLNTLIGIINCRLFDFLFNLIQPSVDFGEGYFEKLPLPKLSQSQETLISHLAAECISLARLQESLELDSSCSMPVINARNGLNETIRKTSLTFLEESLHRLCLEGEIEHIVCGAYGITDNLASIYRRVGEPVAWLGLVSGYGDEILTASWMLPMRKPTPHAVSDEDMLHIKEQVRTAWFNGYVAKDAPEDESSDEDSVATGDGEQTYPTESLLEQICRRVSSHPISVYWLLKEGIEKEGWRCIPEEQRFVTDQFTVTILRLLGHRWPRQVEAGEAVPDWADQDGIIPITTGTQEATLADRVRARIAADFPGGDVASIEREFAEIMGKPLDRWLETDFFKHHTQQFKKRPIAWQLQSSKYTSKRKPAFACLLYYHKLDGDTLPKLRSQYVGPLRQRLETEQRGIEAVPKDSRSDRQTNRLRELTDQLSELRDFDKGLEHVQSSGFAFAGLAEQLRAEPIDALCSPDGIRPPPSDHADFLRQEQSYLPDINDGVRVNIAPLQQAGLLSADVLAGKDLDKAITDRATWRSDERRWTRAGKLPQPGYFRAKRVDPENDTELTISPQGAGSVSQVTG